jgi:hypothetical protein
MAEIWVNLKQSDCNPNQEEFRIQRVRFENECRTIGAEVEGHDGSTVFLKCTHKQLREVFSFCEGCDVMFTTRLSEIKCEHVVQRFKGTSLEKELSYGSSHYEPCSIFCWVTNYEEYCLVMSAIKDVRKNYGVQMKKSLVRK